MCYFCHDLRANPKANNHKSANCLDVRNEYSKNYIKPENIVSKQNCKVFGCPFNHITHFCKKCRNPNASHRSYNCYKN